MQLIFVRNEDTTLVGKPVKVGDTCQTFRGEQAEVVSFREPSSPASEGRVTVRFTGLPSGEMEYYVGVVGASWVDREDR